jgi:hypothetical protein
MYVQSMTHMRIRDLQKISEETISALKSGDRTAARTLKTTDPGTRRSACEGRDPGR